MICVLAWASFTPNCACRLKASETPAAVAAVSRQPQVAYLAAMPCLPTVTGQQCLAAVSPAVTTAATAGKLAGGRATSI